MKKICSLLFFFFIYVLFSMSVNAQLDDFKTKSMSEDEFSQKYSSITISSSDTYKPSQWNFEHITSFDVSECGLIAVGIEGSIVPFVNFFPDDHIVIIDNDGNIVSCIRYWYPYSNAISVGWHNDNVLIIEHRGGVIIEISPDGEIIEYYDISAEENDDIRFLSKPAAKIIANETTYKMEKNELFTMDKFTKISMDSPDYGHCVIFNIDDYADKSQYIIILVIIGVFIIELAVLLFYVIPKNRKKKAKLMRSNQN